MIPQSSGRGERVRATCTQYVRFAILISWPRIANCPPAGCGSTVTKAVTIEDIRHSQMSRQSIAHCLDISHPRRQSIPNRQHCRTAYDVVSYGTETSTGMHFSIFCFLPPLTVSSSYKHAFTNGESHTGSSSERPRLPRWTR